MKGFTGQRLSSFLMSPHARLLALFLVCIGAALLSLQNGPIDRFLDDPRVAQNWNQEIWNRILWDIRLPRVLLALVVGGALAVSGLICQSVLQNPLADPYLLGISSGASVAAILSIGSFGLVSGLGLNASAFAGGVSALFLTFLTSGRKRFLDPSSLILAGAITTFFLSAMALLLLSFVRSPDLPGILFWLAGDLSFAQYGEVIRVALATVPVILVAVFFARELKLLEAGDDEARSLGVRNREIRAFSLLAVTLATATAVAHAGMIGFLGLMVPHAVRGFLGHSFRIASAGSFLLGGTFLLIADYFARVIFPVNELPVGALTALVGCPFLIVLLRRGSLV